MANFYGSARTNYFKVKDKEVFLKALEHVPDIEVVNENTPPYSSEGVVPDDFDFGGMGILVSEGDCGCFPSWGYDGDNDEELEFDLPILVSEHLVDGEVAIFMECGAEKLRYVTGWAQAINNKAETKFISLTDIYSVAKELTNRPDDITHAEY